MASISIRNLVKRYGNFAVIPDLNLEIADHEFVVFVGPSGCGKSTLLRIIAGLEPITAGEVYIGDKRVNGVPAAQRDIAMVFQDYALYPHMRVYDNMSFALELRGTPKAEIDARVKRAAALLHIEPYLDRKPKELSGGQRQRVAMGRAIVRNPKAFLFDEPLSNLDAKLRGQVRAEIKALSQELKTTMVFVTHDQIEAMTMADRIVVLQSGTVQQYDTPEAVYERPANQFVAGFIGSPAMNFFPVEWRGEGVVFSQGGAAVPLGRRAAARCARPAVACSESVPSISLWRLIRPTASRSTIKLVEPLGSDTLIHFDLAGASAIARVDPSLRPKVGELISLRPQPGKIHLFDSADGRVLQ